MLRAWVVPAVVGAIVLVEGEIVATTGRTEEFTRLPRRFQLADMVQYRERHERVRIHVVVADFSVAARFFLELARRDLINKNP